MLCLILHNIKFYFLYQETSFLFSQELAFHEEEKTRNKQVEFLSFQLRLLLLVDCAVQSYEHYVSFR